MLSLCCGRHYHPSLTLLLLFVINDLTLKLFLPQRMGWQDVGGQVKDSQIPAYCVAEDKFAGSYIAGLQRQKRLKTYLNQVYHGV